MTAWQYTKGLHDLGNGGYAYLQPDGSWGWSNAGLIVDGDESLLVDTLFDLEYTGEMLSAMRAAAPAAADIGTLVNTHGNADHYFGNELVEGAEIIASDAAVGEMQRLPPEMVAALMREAPNMGPAGEFFLSCFGDFNFEGIKYTPPSRTFSGNLDLKVGDKQVLLMEVGPAHSDGDVMVHVPADRTVFTGDILFIDDHPIMWAGPVGNWIAACQLIMDMDVETIVPGHGPITDKAGVARLRDYLVYIRDEARARFDSGMPLEEAAQDISLSDYSSWGCAERIVVNVATLFREFSGDTTPANVPEMFQLMAKIH